MSDTRRTRSGKIYVCLSKVVQETDPLFLHPSLTTLNYDICTTTKDPADMGQVSQTKPADTGQVSQNKPDSDFSYSTE